MDTELEERSHRSQILCATIVFAKRTGPTLLSRSIIPWFVDAPFTTSRNTASISWVLAITWASLHNNCSSTYAVLTTTADLVEEHTTELRNSLVSEGIIKKGSDSSQAGFRFVDIEKTRLKYFDPTKHIVYTQPVGSLFC
jgi:hypothetical protein